MDKIEEIEYDWDEAGSHLLEEVVAKMNQLIRVTNYLLDQDPKCCDNGNFGEEHYCQKKGFQ
jgi:hypothetical protein